MAVINRTYYLLSKLRRDLGDKADNPDADAWLLDDTGLVYSNVQLLDALDSAIHEACLRFPLERKDRGTDGIDLLIEADVTQYDLHPSILTVESATLETADKPLANANEEVVRWTRTYPYAVMRFGNSNVTGMNWWALPAETYYVSEDKTITLVGAPTEADTLLLTVKRMPLRHLVWPVGTTVEAIRQGLFVQPPETLPEHDLSLLDYAKFELWSVNERDADAPAKADAAIGKFNAVWGPKPLVGAWAGRMKRSNRRTRARAHFV